jgi:uncharacterized heparinase superfamily protein
MRHDGYVERYGIVHQRRLSFSDSGDRLDGVDSFLTPTGRPVEHGKDGFAIRFHLHPGVRATHAPDRRAIVMELPDGETWAFETDASDLSLEESIMFSDARGNRQTEQIVIHGRVQAYPSISWQLHRTALGGRRQRLIGAAAPARV